MSQSVKKNILHVLFLCVLFGMVSACESNSADSVVAKVGESNLTLSELQASIQYASPKDSATAAAIYIEDWKHTAALYDLACQANIESDPLAQVLLEKAKRRIFVQRFVDIEMKKAEAKGAFRVDSIEVSAYYEMHKQEFVYREPAVKLIRLYASSSDSATRMARALGNRRFSFDELVSEAKIIAPELDTLNTHALQDSEEFVRISRLHLESDVLQQLLEKMRPSNISPIVKLNDSLFVVMRLETRVETGTEKPLEAAYDEIKQRLKLKKQNAFYIELQKRARKAAQR
ncbi:hypothetical protein Ctha_0312 [Chloroherpeton thalassium ATCC 35110]|uniref:PpiC domain-containing protein n=1 Tax=Chloroherpeton thalassium (strain ATCC 35110 / GB-78) TaxID=517418 RepID=B3QTY5_CHLT3|nr:peptidylprolyl isomerase [Chloroherpeton thalassium]ACF12783.1 hypothetical protein Ctha_0312 [Chloroherpeton thalassium ATCC 35110]